MEDESTCNDRIDIGDYTLDKRKKLGSGGFGDIYYGCNKLQKQEVAIKIESLKSSNAVLIDEARKCKHLQGGVGIPRLFWYGINNTHNIMILELLGKSLEDLRIICGGNFSLKTVTLLWYQMLNRLEFMHNKEYIHRDIKPDNFVMGIGKNKDILYIIDFGLSKRYRDLKTGRHIPLRNGKSLVGTARFASIYTHYGYEQSRRDDLESLFFVLIYLVKGSLPWQGIQAKVKKEKYEKILKLKENTSLKELCKNLPIEFENFVNYSRNLKFEKAPDYSYLRGLITKVILDEKFVVDNEFSWISKFEDVKSEIIEEKTMQEN